MTGADWIHVFFLMAIGQGFFMAFILARRANKGSGPARLLSAGMVVFSIVLIYWIAYWRNLYEGHMYVGWLLDPIDLLMCPLIFLFARNQIQERGLSKIDLLHFLPYVIYTLNVFNSIAGYYYGLGLYRLPMEVYTYSAILKSVQFLVYPVWLFFISRQTPARWLSSLVLILFFHAVLRILYLVLSLTGVLTLDVDYLISIAIVISIYSISYLVNFQPERIFTRKRYERSSLDYNHEKMILEKSSEHILETKSFLNPDYRISQLSSEISIPKHHISQAINHTKGKSFNEFMNDFRVEHSQTLLTNSTTTNDTILAIALDSGFNNKVSFYNNFKRVTGISPKEFRQRVSEGLEQG